MSDESNGFSQAKVRLEEIVSQVRKKDTSLEKSLDLLEEGVRLANRCTELIDQADWDAAAGASGDDSADAEPDSVNEGAADGEENAG
jgi:exodeoxyribonuclease VII small subunit